MDSVTYLTQAVIDIATLKSERQAQTGMKALRRLQNTKNMTLSLKPSYVGIEFLGSVILVMSKTDMVDAGYNPLDIRTRITNLSDDQHLAVMGNIGDWFTDICTLESM